MAEKNGIVESNSDAIQNKEEETDYVQFIDDVGKLCKDMSSNKERFVSFADRKYHSVLDIAMMKNLCHGKYLSYWKGMNLMKDSLDLTIYQQLLWYEKPKTIIELGAYTGACAVWMADMCRSYGYDTHVYSVDINLDMVDKIAMQDKNVTFIKGDSNLIEKAFPPDMLEKLPHPWVIAEDAHVNVIGVLEYFDKYMLEGDYFIIDDTSPESPLFSGQGLLEEKGYTGFGDRKLSLLKKFLEMKADAYKIDTFYTDFFGYNGTFNWDGYVRKMK